MGQHTSHTTASSAGSSSRSPEGRDIKSFVSEKAPSSDTHFATTVAYYYQFEAPDVLRKDAITAEDLQDATRKCGRTRLTNPGQTLINSHRDGLLDKAGERGAYTLNTVGENLIAMTLPLGTGEMRPVRKKAQRKGIKTQIKKNKANTDK